MWTKPSTSQIALKTPVGEAKQNRVGLEVAGDLEAAPMVAAGGRWCCDRRAPAQVRDEAAANSCTAAPHRLHWEHSTGCEFCSAR